MKASKYSLIKSSRFSFRFLFVERDEDEEADEDDVDEDEDEFDEDLRKFFRFRRHMNNTTKFMTTMTRPMPDMMPARTVVLNLNSFVTRCDGV